MKVFRLWCFVMAVFLSPSFASTEQLIEVKELVQSMELEMDRLRSEMGAERCVIRENTGGVPAVLRSKSGNATVKIGGEIAVRYYADFKSNYNHQGSTGPSGGGEYADKIGWTMDTASITFDVAVNQDMGIFIDVRHDRFDKAYYYWNNISGSDFGLQVGFIGIPGGMYSSSFNPWGRVFISNPVAKEFGVVYSVEDSSAANNPGDDIKRMGVQLSYVLDQIKITGTVFSATDLGEPNDLLDGYDGNDTSTISAYNGDVRNNGFVNHSIMIEYMPAFIEGLNFAATYMGMVDMGQGSFTTANRRGTSYSPQFDLGAAYIKDKYAFYVEADYTFGQGYYADTFSYCLSLGADYAVTDKFGVAVGADYGMIGSSNDLRKSIVADSSGVAYPNYESAGVRARIAAKYQFEAGVWVKAEYGHVFYSASGVGDSSTKSRDTFIFETGVEF